MLTRPAPPVDATVRYGPEPEQVIDFRWPADGPDRPADGADDGLGRPADGPDDGLVGDVGSPGRPAATPRPLVVVIHGGFWRAEYDRAHTGPLAADLAARGYPVAQIEYRRTGQSGGGWPGTFDDVAAAVATAVAVAPALAASLPPPGKLAAGPPILLGHSAGGHLALWYASLARPGQSPEATSPRSDDPTRPAPERVGGVLALAPVADLAGAYQLDLDGGAVAALLGGGPDELPERYAAADPHRMPPASVPTVLLHGGLDRQVPVELSRGYLTRARAGGAGVRLIELPDCEHFGLIDPESPAWPQVTTALHSLLPGSRTIDGAPTSR